MISPLDWTNVRRTFDGGRVMIASPDNQLDVFVVKPVIVEVESFNDTDDDSLFAGVYDVISLPNVGGKPAGTNSAARARHLKRACLTGRGVAPIFIFCPPLLESVFV